MMKGFTPGLTLVLSVLLGKERFSVRLAAAVVAVCGGTAAAAVLERRTLHFSAKGMLWMLLSSLSESLRVVMIQTVGETRPLAAAPAASALKPSAQQACAAHELPCDSQCRRGSLAEESTGLGGTARAPASPPVPLNLAETLMYVSGPSSVVLAGLSSFIERRGVLDALLLGSARAGGANMEALRGETLGVAGGGNAGHTLQLLAAVAVASLVTNLAGYAAVQVTSSTLPDSFVLRIFRAELHRLTPQPTRSTQA